MEKNLGIVYNKSPKWDSYIHARNALFRHSKKPQIFFRTRPQSGRGKQNRRTA